MPREQGHTGKRHDSTSSSFLGNQGIVVIEDVLENGAWVSQVTGDNSLAQLFTNGLTNDSTGKGKKVHR